MKFKQTLLALAITVSSVPVLAATGEVFKSPSCGCCSKWVDHMTANGFELKVYNQHNMQPIKQKHGITGKLFSCHTAIIEGYVIEGHVPAADIKRLLEEKPDIAGLAVPKMPHGTPGMETGRVDPYHVVAFRKDGSSYHFSSYHQ